MSAERTSRARSVFAEGLLLVLMAFGPLAFGGVEPWATAGLQIMIFGLFALSLKLPAASTTDSVHRALLPATLFLVALAGLQRLHPVVPDGILPVWVPFTSSAHDTSEQLLTLLSYAALIFSVPRVLKDEDSANRFMWSLFLLGVFISVVGLLQKNAGNTHYYGIREMSRWRVPFGPYPNSNHAANLMIMSGFAGVGLALSRIPRRKIFGLGEIINTLASGALISFLILILFYGVFAAHARAAWISLFLSSMALLVLATGFLRRSRTRGLARGALIGVCLAAGTAVFKMSPQIRNSLDPASHSFSMRVSMYRSGWEMVQDFPFFGTGLGSLPEIFRAYQDWGHITYFVNHIHCEPLELMIEMGALGLIPIVLALGFVLVRAARHYMHQRHGVRRCLTIGALGGSLSFLLHSLVDFPFHIPGNAIVFLILISWLATAPPSDTDTPVRYPVGFFRAAYLSALLLGFIALRPAIASRFASASQNSSSAARPFYLTKAWAWDKHPRYQYALAATYLQLSHENPLAQKALLDLAIQHADIAYGINPLNDRYAYLKGLILWRMGRRLDARPFLARRPPLVTAPPNLK